MTTLVKIAYVGKKPHAFDNVAHSGKHWKGKGDVQIVTAAQAKLLLRHPDQWGLADQSDANVLADATPAPLVVQDEDDETVAVGLDALQKPLEKMSKPELCAFARHALGKELSATLNKKAMIDQIEEWQQTGP